MRILFVSDYASWNPISKGKMPSNHLFGIHQKIKHYYTDKNGKLHGELSDGEGTVDFYLVQKYKMLPWFISRILHSLIIWLISFQYTIILDAINQCRILLLFNRLHLLPCKIITILHHPPFYFEEELGGADAYLFFSKNTLRHDAQSVPSKKEKFFLNEWGPDICWYPSLAKGKERFICCDDGKTHRDIELEKKLIKDLKIRSLTTYQSELTEKLPSSFTQDVYAKILNAKIMFIPIQKSAFPRQLHLYEKYRVKQKNDIIPDDPCGLTSFMDAVALEMPVICSDNTLVAEFVKEYHLGKVYKSGDIESAKNAFFQLMNNNDEYNICKKNLVKYKETHSMDIYSNRLFTIINKITNK